jgi:ABC-type transport system involved in multi-copper enzyme maturation permease subunit
MKEFGSGVSTILALELRQRVRGTAWYVLLGIFVALIAVVTVLLQFALVGLSGNDAGAENGGIYSTIIYFVLLLGTLVAPALSGNAINGDRDAGTLATTQVTLVTTWQIIVGKFLAAWITALAFLAAAIPFLIYASIVGQLSAVTIVISLVILAVELGVVAAIGVGLSGILNRPLFSIVVTYLVVAALSVGTLIAFGLGGLSVQSTVTSTTSSGLDYDENTGMATSCSSPETYQYQTPRFDYFWGVLVANPYVLLADAVPAQYGRDDYPDDLFGNIQYAVRQAQVAPELTVVYNECDPASMGQDEYGNYIEETTPRETIDSTVPGWFVGLAIHLLLAVGALVGAWARTRTPAGRLSRGSRIA